MEETKEEKWGKIIITIIKTNEQIANKSKPIINYFQCKETGWCWIGNENKTQINCKRFTDWKWEDRERKVSCNWKWKAGVTIFILTKQTLKQSVTRGKEHYIMIKGSSQKENIAL